MEILLLLLLLLLLLYYFLSLREKSLLKKNKLKSFNKKFTKKSLKQKQINRKKKISSFYIRRKGWDGENAFIVFLKELEIPFIAVEQNKYTKYSRFKRPDFILGGELNNKTSIAFEVKNKQTHLDKFGKECHKLEKYEVNGLENFSKDMSMPVYFAFKNNNDWFFISLKCFSYFSFDYKNEFYIRLCFFERDVKSKSDLNDFISKISCN